jgi:hypothetical protein
MSDSESHPIRTGVIITVLGGLILAALIFIVPRAASFIWSLILAFWNFLISEIVVRWFVLIILILLSVPTVWGFIKPLLRQRKGPTGPSLDDYTEDNFYNAIWRWKTFYNNFPDGSLWCFCPNCNTRLVYKNEFETDRRGNMGRITIFTCETCHTDVTRLEGDKEFALSTVARQIERKVNTGEWKRVVAKATK